MSRCEQSRNVSNLDIHTCIQAHSQAAFTHDLCPDCIKSCFPEY